MILTAGCTEWRDGRGEAVIRLRYDQAPPPNLAVAYQIVDPETGVVVAEGPRVFPPAAVPNGEVELRLPLEAPHADGLYRIHISCLEEGIRWHWAAGFPFLLSDLEVTAGRPRVQKEQVTTRAALERRVLWRSAGRAIRYPVRTIWRNRQLIRSMVRRDILARYRGSALGAVWTVVNPLLLMLTYFFVFGVVLRARFEGDPSRSGFVLYFLAGMLPWLAFSEAAGRAPVVIWEHANLLKKLVFPSETLPVNITLAGLVTEACAIGIFALALLAVRGAIPPAVFWLPVVLIPQALFTAGVAWILAALGVFLRDLGHINAYLLTLWFFITPICYPESALPPEAEWILRKNPMFVMVRAYRDIFLEGRAPAFGPMWKLWVLSFFLFFAGHAWFYKLRRTFAEIL